MGIREHAHALPQKDCSSKKRPFQKLARAEAIEGQPSAKAPSLGSLTDVGLATTFTPATAAAAAYSTLSTPQFSASVASTPVAMDAVVASATPQASPVASASTSNLDVCGRYPWPGGWSDACPHHHDISPHPHTAAASEGAREGVRRREGNASRTRPHLPAHM